MRGKNKKKTVASARHADQGSKRRGRVERIMHGGYRGFVQGKTRITLAWIFAFLLIFSARDYPNLPGIFICFVGASLRFWASGYLRKDSRPAVGGPYSFVRNPLYLGTYLMATGTAWASRNEVLFVAVTVVFGAIYYFIILDEETKLHEIFGPPYKKYCENVPRFFPRFWPPLFPAGSAVLRQINPDLTHHGFSWPLAMKNKAYEAYASFGALVLFMLGIACLWRNL